MQRHEDEPVIYGQRDLLWCVHCKRRLSPVVWQEHVRRHGIGLLSEEEQEFGPPPREITISLDVIIRWIIFLGLIGLAIWLWRIGVWQFVFKEIWTAWPAT